MEAFFRLFYWEAGFVRDGLPTREGFVAMRSTLVAEVKFFGRYRAGWIRDEELLRVRCPS